MTLPLMISAFRLTTTACALTMVGFSIAPTAEAGPKHHRHSHQETVRQRAFNNGYQRGYNQAVQKRKVYNNAYRKGYKNAVKYKNYRPYQPYRYYSRPVRRPVIVAPNPWIVPAPVVVNPYPYRYRTVQPRVNVGFGFNL